MRHTRTDGLLFDEIGSMYGLTRQGAVSRCMTAEKHLRQLLVDALGEDAKEIIATTFHGAQERA